MSVIPKPTRKINRAQSRGVYDCIIRMFSPSRIRHAQVTPYLFWDRNHVLRGEFEADDVCGEEPTSAALGQSSSSIETGEKRTVYAEEKIRTQSEGGGQEPPRSE